MDIAFVGKGDKEGETDDQNIPRWSNKEDGDMTSTWTRAVHNRIVTLSLSDSEAASLRIALRAGAEREHLWHPEAVEQLRKILKEAFE